MKTRIISSIVAILLAAVILLFHDSILIYLAIAAFSSIMLFEVFSALKCLEYKSTASVCFIFSFVTPIFLYKDLKEYRYSFLIACIIAIFITFLLQYKKLMFEKLCVMLATSILITLAMNSLLELLLSDEDHGLFLLILSLCGAWLADTGAYFAGTFFGKHKLCPNISPKKTVEGLIGGTITDALLFVGIGLLYSYLCERNGNPIEINYIFIAVLGAICSLLGLLGDLSASLLKRQCNIKDYGNIMPGHGGVLDRFDSVLFVVPFMSLATKYITLIQ